MGTVLTHTFTSTEKSAGVELFGPFNLSISGTFTATVTLERAFLTRAQKVADLGDSDYNGVDLDVYGVDADFTVPIEIAGDAVERRTAYRFNCTWTSGTSAICRLSQ